MELRNRYLSLDLFRGMDVALMIVVNTAGDGATTFAPLHHARWNGFTLTDLVFPTFLFIVGTSLSFSLQQYESIGTGAVLKKILKRTAIIFLLGYLMYWFPFVRQTEAGEWILKPFSDTRVFGVLQRIALCYGLGALIIHFWKIRGALLFSVLALLLYWILLVAFGDLSLTGNAVLKLDLWLLGDHHLYHGEHLAFDPEGLLSTLPAIVNVLAGYCAGIYLKEKGPSYETISKMLMAGAVLIFVGLSWDLVFPINKKLWTSSFVVYTSGIDFIVLSMLVYLIDLRQQKSWTYFFEVFGRNTLFIYLLSELLAILLSTFSIQDMTVYRWIFLNLVKPWAGGYAGSLIFAVAFMLLCWSVGYWMDRRKLYVKI
jgi:predicted acyltransferase